MELPGIFPGVPEKRSDLCRRNCHVVWREARCLSRELHVPSLQGRAAQQLQAKVQAKIADMRAGKASATQKLSAVAALKEDGAEPEPETTEERLRP